jgi:hypothetical protein
MSGADDHIGVAMARAARQREAAERRAARKNLIEFKRAMGSGRARRLGGGGRVKRQARRATGRAGGRSKKNYTLGALARVHGGGLASDKYAERHGKLIDTNMLSQSAIERLAEWMLDAAMRSDVDPKNLFKHVSISLPAGRTLSKDHWAELVRRWVVEIAGGNVNYVVQLHADQTRNEHVHITFSRVLKDKKDQKGRAKLVSDSFSHLKWTAALRKIQLEMVGEGVDVLKDVQHSDLPVEYQRSRHHSDRSVNGARRAERKGMPDAYIDADQVRRILSKCTTASDFKDRCLAIGIEVTTAEKNGRKTGILYSKTGSAQTLAGSSISRDLSLSSVEKALTTNAKNRQNGQTQNPAPQSQAKQNHQRPVQRRG